LAKAEYSEKEIDGTYGDYLEIMIQIGYVVLFSVSFPLAPLLAFVNNIFEIKIDQAKVMYFTRRPMPMGAQSIGIWKVIFQGMTTLGIFSTFGLIVITAETFTGNPAIAF